MATATSMGFSLFSTWDSRGIKQARRDLTGVQKFTRSIGETAKVAFGAAALAVGAYTGALLKAGIESNALTQRVNKALETTLGSAGAAKEQLEELREFGKTSPIQLPVWLKAQQQLLAFGMEAQKVVPMLGAIQDAVIAAGGTEEEIKGVVRALGQMQSKGKLSAEELNQIGERGIDAAGVVARAFGTTSQEIRQGITEGTIGVDEFFDGFIKGSEMAFGGAAEGARQTFAGMVDRLKGAHRRIGEILATPLVDPDGGGAFVELGNALADAMNNFEDALRPLMEQFSNQLEPAIERGAAAIRNFGESITEASLREFFMTIKEGIPILTAFGTAVGVHFGSEFLELLPGFQRLAQVASPLAFGLSALAATSPELRGAFVDVGQALTPLLPVASELAVVIAHVLTDAIKVVTPLITVVAGGLKVLTDNFAIVAPIAAVAAAGMATYGLSASTAGTAATAAGIATLRLRDAMIALRASMAAHPVLLIATILAAVGTAFVMAAEEANAWKDDVRAAFAQVESGAKSFKDVLDDVAGDKFRSALDELFEAMDQVDDKSKQVGSSASILGAELQGQVNATNRLKEAEEDLIPLFQDLDAAMAGQVESGANSAIVMSDVKTMLDLTDEELNTLIPHLDEYIAANAAAREELQQVAESGGNAMAAVMGLGEEMKKQTDPFFALVSATNAYDEALKKFQETTENSEASQRDIEAAAVDVAGAMLDMQIAGEEAATLFGEGLPPDFLALAESMGMPKSAIDTLEQAFATDTASITSAAGQMVAQGIDHMKNFMAMISELSLSESEAILNAKESMDALMESGMSYAEAIQFVADNSTLSTAQIEDGFGIARAAGLEFSDDYPAHVRLEGKEAVLGDIDQMIQKFLGFSESVRDSVDSIVNRGYDMDDAYKIVALNMGLSVDEVKEAYQGAEVSTGTNVDNMISDLQSWDGKMDDTSVATDNMGRRHNANMGGMDSNTDDHINNMIDRFNDMMDNGIFPTQSSIGDLAGEWGSKMSNMVGNTSSSFQSIQNSILTPVRFIIDSIYNKGIVRFWNAISNAMFGGDNTMSTIGLPSGGKSAKRRAGGGSIHGPGTSTSDSIPALLSDGEYVLKASAVQKYGVNTLNALNAGQVEPQKFWLGGFVKKAGGALLDAPGEIFDAMGDVASGDWAQGLFGNFAKFGDMLGNVKDFMGDLKGDKNSAKLVQMLKSGMQRAVSRLTDVWDMLSSVGGGGALGGYQQMFEWINNIVPGANMTSGFRQGDPGYHGRGMAVDMAFNDGSERRGGGQADQAFEAIVAAWKKQTAELIWDYSPLGYGRGIWNGREHTFNSASAAPPSHNDHIHWAMSGGGAGMGSSGKTAGKWSHVASAALREAGLYSGHNLQNVLRAIQKESSGNPAAINRWDVNARNGTPSMGLLQTIGPTFAAYAGKYRNRGILNPFANIYAAVRYASSRYGSGWSSRMAQPGGYAEGGLASGSYDSGGYLPTGYSIAHNGTGRPEPVGHDLGEGGTTVVNIDLRGAYVPEGRQMQEAVLAALTQLGDKGRLRNIKINPKRA